MQASDRDTGGLSSNMKDETATSAPARGQSFRRRAVIPATMRRLLGDWIVPARGVRAWLAPAWLVLFTILCAFFAELSFAQPVDTAAIEQTKTTLEEIEATLGREGVSAETLAGLRQKLNATMDALRAAVDELEPRVRDAEERLKQLGPAPAKDAPPESADIANEREELSKNFSELDGALKQARVLSVHGDQ